MGSIDRREFLTRSGLALGAAMLTADLPIPKTNAAASALKLEQEEKQEKAVLRAAAEYLAVDSTEIALTDSTTMGLGLLYGGLRLKKDQEIVTTIYDHYSTETSLRLRAERTGATIRQIPLYKSLKSVSRNELVDTLVQQVRPHTRVIAVTWVHSSTGLKLPIDEMATAIAAINRARSGFCASTASTHWVLRTFG
jgi:selenocysteine lyase/cysteine desulfurase